MKALYHERVQRQVCPTCEAPAQHDGHIYCRDCRCDYARKMRVRRYMTTVTIATVSSTLATG